MKIQLLSFYPYQIPLVFGQMRAGLFIKIKNEKGEESWGEIAPLPKGSQETLKECIEQLNHKKQQIIKINWTVQNWSDELQKLALLPAVSFGLESALLALLLPLSAYTMPTSALLMGSYAEILEQAHLRQQEGFTSAKLKVSALSFKEAADLIYQLKNIFHLRIDVNRAWKASESLPFFSQFPLDTFDYVEEPFQNPQELAQFPHPLAIDESFPADLSLEQLDFLPTLKAVIYKPTIQGGLLGCLALQKWAKIRGIAIVLSSSFESDLGLAHVVSLARRLSLSSPIGIGTYHYLKEHVCEPALRFSQAWVAIPTQLVPKKRDKMNDFCPL